MVLHYELVFFRTVVTFGKKKNCEEKIHPEVSKRAPGRKGRRLNAEERLENEVWTKQSWGKWVGLVTLLIVACVSADRGEVNQPID